MAAQDKVTFKQDLTEPVKIRHYEGVVFTGDDCGNLIKVALFDGGAPYSGGGTVSATAVLADGTTFPLTHGSITGNMVSVPLEAGALVVSGLMGLYVKISGGGIICTVLNAIFTVQVTDTGRVPAATVTTVNELVAAIRDAQDSIPADLTNLLAAVAPTFSTSTAYSAGAYVWQGGKLYRFTAAHPAGTWTGTDAVEVALGNDVADLKSAVGNIETLSNEMELSWVIGGLANNGTENNNTNRLRTDYIDVRNATFLYVTVGTGYLVNIIRFRPDKSWIGASSWTGSMEITATGLGYVRFALKQTPDSSDDMSVSEGDNVTLTFSNVLNETLSNINNDISLDTADLARLKLLEYEKIPYIYQYLDNTNGVDTGYYYTRVPDNADLGVPTKTAGSTFNAYDPIVLYPGTYTILDTIAANISFVVVSGKCYPATTYFEITSSYSGDITVNTAAEFYVSANKTISPTVRIVNKNSFTGVTIPTSYGLVYGEINPVIRVSDDPGTQTDTSYYDQAFIKNGELTCNNDHKTDNNTIAKYTQVDMGSNVTKIMCEGYFKDQNNNGSITLIATKLDTYSNVGNIIYGSLHIGFSPTKAAVQIFVNRALTTLQEFTYETAVRVKYTFGWEISDNTLIIHLPDGTTQTVTDERLSDLNGKYMIFEHFKASSNTGTPTDDFNQPVITGIYCECANGTTLRDNFKRADGAPNISPTGHVYIQYRNSSYISADDTIFTNQAGSINN